MSKSDPFAAPEPNKTTKKPAAEVLPSTPDPDSGSDLTPDAGSPEKGLEGPPTPEGTGKAPETAEEATTTAGEPIEPSQYGGFTVAELREELTMRDLTQSGNKADLISRLEEDDAKP